MNQFLYHPRKLIDDNYAPLCTAFIPRNVCKCAKSRLISPICFPKPVIPGSS